MTEAKVLFYLSLIYICGTASSFALISPSTPKAHHPATKPHSAPPAAIVEQLGSVRGRVLDAEKTLIQSLKEEDQARARAVRLKAVLELRKQERELARRRSEELNELIRDLERRKKEVSERIHAQQRSAYSLLKQIERFSQLGNAPVLSTQREKTEGPRRRVAVALAKRGVGEIEALRVDLIDAELLEEKIRGEKGSLVALLSEIQETESVISFQSKLENDVLKKRHTERIEQLVNYHNLQSSQAALEGLIRQMNARVELEKMNEASRDLYGKLRNGAFASKKGSLTLPVFGQIVSTFGKSRDPSSNLLVLRKGLEIKAPASSHVKSVFAGKVAFSGTLPGYGLMTILDHGAHYYTLVAKMVSVAVHAGDLVKEGDVIGMTGKADDSIYFEVRDRNLAVDPLQWVARSNTL